MIKQCVAGVVAVVMSAAVWAASNDDEAAALASLNEVQKLYDTRPQGSHALTPDDINQCVDRMQDAKAKLAAVKQQYGTTQAYQSMQTRFLYSRVMSQLGTCKQTKETLGY